jgi:predicted DNA-binding transcriptional regulator AlpA
MTALSEAGLKESITAQTERLARVVERIDKLFELIAKPAPVNVMIAKPELAKMVAVSVSTIDRMRPTGELGPQPVLIGDSLRWSRIEVEAWLANRQTDGSLHDAESWAIVWPQLQKQARKN